MVDYTKIFHTVPYKEDSLTRNKETGKKSTLTPLKKWSYYIKNRNTKNTPILAAIALKEFIGIDIDNNNTWNLIHPLVKDKATYIAKSDIKGGHILFRYSPTEYEELQKIRKYLRKLNIDIQMDNHLIYLATPANKTKTLLTEPLNNLDELTYMPKELLLLLKGIVTAEVMVELDSAKTLLPKATTNYIKDYHGRILKEPSPAIVHKLTPKKDYPDIYTMNQIPKGSGTDWMLQVRRKLQDDPSVDADTFVKTMLYLNSLWDDPMDEDRVIYDCERDVNSPKWVYDKDYNKKSIILYSVPDEDTLEVLYDPKNNIYILFNRTKELIWSYNTGMSIIDTLMALTRIKFTKEQLLKKINTITTINTPLEEPYYNPTTGNFNIFIPSKQLLVMRDPSLLKEYKEPTTILHFLEHLIPDETIRELFIRFLAHKYTTYEHSPLYFAFAGVGGAGKGLLVHEILSYLSPDRVYNIEASRLIGNNFNSFLDGTDWLEIEEATEGLSKRENDKLIAYLKRTTGNPYVSVEYKNADIQKVRHFITPILSTNIQSKLITSTVDDDRRLVFVKSPVKLIDDLPAGHTIETYIAQMKRELIHFAAYLGKIERTNPISTKDYIDNTNWKTRTYYDLVEQTVTPLNKIVSAVSARDYHKIRNILQEAGVTDQDINALFHYSKNTTVEIILYHTQRTRSATAAPSLEDLVIAYKGLQYVDEDVRKMFAHIKSSIVKRIGAVVVKLNCVTFTINELYEPLNSIAGTEAIDI